MLALNLSIHVNVDFPKSTVSIQQFTNGMANVNGERKCMCCCLWHLRIIDWGGLIITMALPGALACLLFLTLSPLVTASSSSDAHVAIKGPRDSLQLLELPEELLCECLEFADVNSALHLARTCEAQLERRTTQRQLAAHHNCSQALQDFPLDYDLMAFSLYRFPPGSHLVQGRLERILEYFLHNRPDARTLHRRLHAAHRVQLRSAVCCSCSGPAVKASDFWPFVQEATDSPPFGSKQWMYWKLWPVKAVDTIRKLLLHGATPTLIRKGAAMAPLLALESWQAIFHREGHAIPFDVLHLFVVEWLAADRRSCHAALGSQDAWRVLLLDPPEGEVVVCMRPFAKEAHDLIVRHFPRQARR